MHRVKLSLAAAGVVIFVLAGSLSRGDSRMQPVSRAMLCVTEGSLDDASKGQLAVNVAKMRAYVNRPTAQTIEARLTYLGPTANEAPLASGEMRRQFGLKLRAQDPCNLLYVMWRIEPKAEIVVSVKENPGQRTSAECGNRGYHNIRSARKLQSPELAPGSSHSLRAELNDANLRVFVDGAIAWEGVLGLEALRLDGPVGIRSDNARVQFQMRVGELPGAQPTYVLPCKSGPSESD